MEAAAVSSRDRPQIVPGKDRQKSRISNGSALLPGVDGRSGIARRYRDIMSAILVDQGGAEFCSESRKQLVRRFAAAAVLAEQMESRLANGEQIDIAAHATLSSTQVRLAQRIGIDRVPREIGPSLGELLREDQLQRASEGADAPNEEELTETMADGETLAGEAPTAGDSVSSDENAA